MVYQINKFKWLVLCKRIKSLRLRWEMMLEAGFALIQELSMVALYPHLYGSF